MHDRVGKTKNSRVQLLSACLIVCVVTCEHMRLLFFVLALLFWLQERFVPSRPSDYSSPRHWLCCAVCNRLGSVKPRCLPACLPANVFGVLMTDMAGLWRKERQSQCTDTWQGHNHHGLERSIIPQLAVIMCQFVPAGAHYMQATRRYRGWLKSAGSSIGFCSAIRPPST